MPGNATQLKGATAMGVLNTRCWITYIPHILLIKVIRDNIPSSTTRIRVSRRSTRTIKLEQLSRTRRDPPINLREVEFKETEDAPNVVSGTFPIQAQPIDVLFDSGATIPLFMLTWRH